MKNFENPYFSRDIAEFWRRWHISLSSWFRDYLYIPLGGSRGAIYKTLFNVFIIFTVSGFWHGANWTFVFWGVLNAVYFVPLLISNNNRSNLNVVAEHSFLPSIKESLQIILTFSLTAFAWIFFRAESLEHAFKYIVQMFNYTTQSIKLNNPETEIALIVLLVCWEWVMRKRDHGLVLKNISRPLRWLIYLAFCLLILYFFGEEQEFIYFQF